MLTIAKSWFDCMNKTIIISFGTRAPPLLQDKSFYQRCTLLNWASKNEFKQCELQFIVYRSDLRHKDLTVSSPSVSCVVVMKLQTRSVSLGHLRLDSRQGICNPQDFGSLPCLAIFIDICSEMPAQEIIVTNHCAVV